jgi:hypothetical protein
MLAALCLAVAVSPLLGQSAPPAPPAQDDNPFPGEPQTPPAPAKPQSGAPATKPAGGGDNPFPGEDSNAPILPVDSGPGASPDSGANSGLPRGDSGSAAPPRRDADPDGDPVRSPDPPGLTAEDGFSSSRTGLPTLPAENDSDARPGKSTKNKTREQMLQEDLDVGAFYLEKKNWKAAQARFNAAVGLDKENADAVWGLAEAERHLQLYREAAEHYQLFLSYDPQGPHGRAARKALSEVESAALSAGAKNANPQDTPPK